MIGNKKSRCSVVTPKGWTNLTFINEKNELGTLPGSFLLN